MNETDEQTIADLKAKLTERDAPKMKDGKSSPSHSALNVATILLSSTG
jgi:hypothetical protein